MRRLVLLGMIFTYPLLFWSGDCGSDLGEPCRIKGNMTPTAEEILIQFSVLNPCESQYCIAKGSLNGYCTRICTKDGDCGSGWACAAANPFEFPDKQFCVKESDLE